MARIFGEAYHEIRPLKRVRIRLRLATLPIFAFFLLFCFFCKNLFKFLRFFLYFFKKALDKTKNLCYNITRWDVLLWLSW